MQIYIVPEEQHNIYEKLLPQDLAADVSSGRLLLIGAVSDEGDQICGVLLADPSESLWELSYIYVVPACRRLGIGTAMLRLLKLAAHGLQAEEITAAYALLADESGDADVFRAFFEKNGCPVIQTEEAYTVTLHNIGRNLTSASAQGRIQSLSSVPAKRWNDFRERLRELKEAQEPDENASDNLPVYLDPGAKTLYEADISYICMDQKGAVEGCILFSKREDGLLLSYLCLLSDSLSNGPKLMNLITAAWEGIADKHGENTKIYVNTGNRISNKLFLKLSGSGGMLVKKEIVRQIL